MNPTMKTTAITSLTSLMALLLAGCAAVPPERGALPERAVAGLPSSIHLAREGWPDARWWAALGDDQLAALVDAALKDAPSLDVARTRVGSAHAALSRSRADAGLSTALAAGANRQRYSGNGLFPAPIGGAWYTEETVRIEARYDFDWWGRHRAQVAAAAGEINASKASYAAAEQALAAAVAQSYFALQGQWARRASLEQLVAVQRDLVATAGRRLAQGLAAAPDRERFATDLALLEQDLAALDTGSAQEKEALRALLGGDAQALAALHPATAALPDPVLPTRLGMELLARRPDLQAARWRVEAALSRIDAARAAFYPDIDLAASVGLDSISVSKLLEGGSRTLFVGPALSLPLFDSRRLSARLEGTRSERDALIADYNEAVVEAVRDVAQDGAAVQGLQAQLERQRQAAAGTQAVLQATQARLERGLAGRADVLLARQAVLRQQEAALALQTRLRLAGVALIHSLGGGYRAADASLPANAFTRTP
jgi:multidrug efflux system outer membrane protein